MWVSTDRLRGWFLFLFGVVGGGGGVELLPFRFLGDREPVVVGTSAAILFRVVLKVGRGGRVFLMEERLSLIEPEATPNLLPTKALQRDFDIATYIY